MIQEGLDGLHQAEEVLDGKLELSEAQRQKIFEQIGEISGCDVKIQILAKQLMEEVIEEANESWNNWVEELPDRLAEKADQWSSSHSPFWNQKELIKDYSDQFFRDLRNELDTWQSHSLNLILKDSIELFDEEIQRNLEEISSEIKLIDQQIKSNISQQITATINEVQPKFFFGQLGVGAGAVAGGLLAGLVTLSWPLWLAVGAVAVGIGWFTGGHDMEKDLELKTKVFELGWERFIESLDQIHGKFQETVSLIFDERVELATGVIVQAILLYENLLEQQEKAHKETLEQRQAEIDWISQRRQELEQVQKNIEAILPS